MIMTEYKDETKTTSIAVYIFIRLARRFASRVLQSSGDVSTTGPTCRSCVAKKNCSFVADDEQK